MSDNEPGTALDQAVHERLQAEFNVTGKPSLGYFQETLSDAGPRTDTLGYFLHTASGNTYVMFQALRPWTLRQGEPVPPEVASGTPVTGIRHAWRNYRSTYAEIYGADILNTAHSDELRRWNRFFLAAKQARDGLGNPVLNHAGTPQQRFGWQADDWLGYRVWRSPDLIAWTPVETGEPLDGDIALPAEAGDQRCFYRLQILEPAE
jgi:hypothetical protein